MFRMQTLCVVLPVAVLTAGAVQAAGAVLIVVRSGVHAAILPVMAVAARTVMALLGTVRTVEIVP
jgi:hypothetical protein